MQYVTRRRLNRLFMPLVAANAMVWVGALVQFGDRPVLLGMALLAYVFGLRHALDADHIAAIDNVVRKLMQRDRRAESVGLFFSLGHSSVVVAGALAVALTAVTFRHHIAAVRETGAIVGTSVSAFFLLLIALVNLVTLAGIWRNFQRVRQGAPLAGADAPFGGPLAWVFRPLFGAIRSPWQMYPLGLLFGLGFDTATEVGLLGISAAQGSQGVSLVSILVFPALFTAAMVLVDTADSSLMTGAYGWAYVNPLRKLWYNLTITGVSVLVALFIGGVEAMGMLAKQLHLQGSVWASVINANNHLTHLGLMVVALFVVSWLISAGIYRWKGIDEAGVTGR